MNRTIFGRLIRQSTTGEFYPDKITLEEFIDEIEGSLKPFKDNMQHLKGDLLEDKYIEDWCEIFLAWCEIEQERHIGQDGICTNCGNWGRPTGCNTCGNKCMGS